MNIAIGLGLGLACALMVCGLVLIVIVHHDSSIDSEARNEDLKNHVDKVSCDDFYDRDANYQWAIQNYYLDDKEKFIKSYSNVYDYIELKEIKCGFEQEMKP